MRRAMVTNEFAPSHGGVERLLHERARGFQPESLTVFAPYTEGCEAFDRLQAYSVRRSGKPARAVPILRDVVRSLAPLLDCLRQHRRRPFGMIECGQAFPASLFAWLMRRCYGTPYMVWVHGNDLLASVIDTDAYRAIDILVRRLDRMLRRRATAMRRLRAADDIRALIGLPETG